METLGVTLLPALLTLNWAFASAASDCSGFRHLENGRTFFRYNGLYVTFSCNPGFRMHGHRTSSCVSGQWARHPPLCVAPGCPSPGKLLHGTSMMSPDGSLIQFTCNTGFRLSGSPLLYCKGKSWNGSTPVCKELDIMNLFQLKQTSLYKPGIELNQDMSDLKKHFSAVAITAAKETFLKSSLLGASQPKLHLTGNLSKKSQKQPDLLKRLWHDQITTQQPVRPRDTNTKPNTMQGPTKFADPLNQPPLPATLENSPTVSATTSLPATLSKPTQSSILANSTISDQQEQTSKFLHQMFSSAPTGEDNGENSLTLTTRVIDVSKEINLDMSLTVDLSDAKTHSNTLETAPTVSPEILKNSDISSNFMVLIESSTDENILQSLQVTEEVSTAVSTVSSLHLAGSKNEPLAPKAFHTTFMTTSRPPVPSGMHGKEYFLWSTSATKEELTTAVTTRKLHQKHWTTGNMTTALEHPDPHRLLVGQIDGELYDISRSGKIGSSSSSLKKSLISNHDQENTTAKKRVLNQTVDSAPDNTFTISGFEVHHQSKRRPVCPYPPLPAHGTFYFHTIPNPAPFQYKHYIQYACYAGYTLANGDVYSYCLQDGQWSGVTPMCIDLDECVEGLHECQQVCENTFGSYRCSCRLGFQLSTDRMSCTDVNECVLLAGLARCVFGCVNTPGSFYCLCPAGYSMNVTDGHCEDTDECMENTGLGPCANACVNTPGSFHCVCSNGYQLAGDGMSCVPECPPGYRRKRPDLLVGNSTSLPCVDINECEEMEQMQHHQQHKCEWKCVNLPGTHRCICPRGYTQHPNGYQCKDINECTVRNAGCSHICLNHRGGYRCACPEHYRVSPHSRKKYQPV
ncbi:uncharacterized protein si:dkey-163f14.6 [Tachysurus ichikawai]